MVDDMFARYPRVISATTGVGICKSSEEPGGICRCVPSVLDPTSYAAADVDAMTMPRTANEGFGGDIGTQECLSPEVCDGDQLGGDADAPRSDVVWCMVAAGQRTLRRSPQVFHRAAEGVEDRQFMWATRTLGG